MAEGKTNIPTILCSVCEEDQSLKFCVNCQQELCLRCAKAHGKIQATNHHDLIPLQNRSSGAKPKTATAYCKEHTSKHLSAICNDCLCALCDTCPNRDHSNHSVLRTNLNAGLLHRVCVQKTPEFLELLQQLEQEKDASPLKLQLYKTARDMVKSWKCQLLKVIEDDVDKLLDQIEQGIKVQEIILAQLFTSVEEALKTTERQMAVMSNARKVNDPMKLLSNIHESDLISKQARSLLKEIESTRKTYTIDDLLPYRNKLQTIEADVHKLLTVTTFPDDITGRRKYNLMKEIDKIHLGNEGPYKISNARRNSHKEIILYGFNSKQVHKITVQGVHTTFVCKKDILSMATLSKHTHVMIESTYSCNVHVLDDSFRILQTLSFSCEPDGIFPQSRDIFLLTERTDLNSTKISEIEVTKSGQTAQKMLQVCQKCINWHGFLSLHANNQRLTFTTSKRSLVTVNLKTGSFVKHNLKTYLDTSLIDAIGVDEDDNILVYAGGSVHIVSSKHTNVLRNMKLQGEGGGFFFDNDKLWLTAGEYLYTYQ